MKLCLILQPHGWYPARLLGPWDLPGSELCFLWILRSDLLCVAFVLVFEFTVTSGRRKGRHPLPHHGSKLSDPCNETDNHVTDQQVRNRDAERCPRNSSRETLRPRRVPLCPGLCPEGHLQPANLGGRNRGPRTWELQGEARESRCGFCAGDSTLHSFFSNYMLELWRKGLPRWC